MLTQCCLICEDELAVPLSTSRLLISNSPPSPLLSSDDMPPHHHVVVLRVFLVRIRAVVVVIAVSSSNCVVSCPLQPSLPPQRLATPMISYLALWPNATMRALGKRHRR